MKRVSSRRSEGGRARTILILILLTAAAAGAFYAGMYLRERQEPASPGAAPARVPPVARKEAAPVETPKEEPAPAPAPRRRAPRPAPTPEAPAVEAPPATATLHIDSDIPGASVFIDRQYIGTTPVTAKDIAPGSHRLNVSATGHEGIAETIEVQPGERDIMVRFKDVRLDAALDVVHRHRMGSCRGRLSATPQGLRYETSDKDDVFAAPLTGLEIFEVDYLKKNLRIKPRGGKTYNFTEPEDNADRLFVFHRDVDTARQKLVSR